MLDHICERSIPPGGSNTDKDSAVTWNATTDAPCQEIWDRLVKHLCHWYRMIWPIAKDVCTTIIVTTFDLLLFQCNWLNYNNRLLWYFNYLRYLRRLFNNHLIFLLFFLLLLYDLWNLLQLTLQTLNLDLFVLVIILEWLKTLLKL